MLLTDAPLTFREFLMGEPLPLATLFREIFTFLRQRPDAVLFGAQAVNAYCDPPRMTADVDLLSTRAAALAEELRAHLSTTFHVAVRVRAVSDGLRVYQLTKPKNRHLADIRPVTALPEYQEFDGVKVAAPVELVAMKVRSITGRRDRPKGDTDAADLRRLLLAFPPLRAKDGPVARRLRETGAGAAALDTWSEIAARPIEPDEDE